MMGVLFLCTRFRAVTLADADGARASPQVWMLVWMYLSMWALVAQLINSAAVAAYIASTELPLKSS